MKIYPYKTDSKTRYLTAVHIVAIAALAIVAALLYDGGYVSAWFLSFALAFVGLTVLSVPRKIAVDDSTIYIRCILDITEIPFSEIASVRAVGKKDMRWVLPIFAGVGFFGYYGHFINIKGMRHVEIYASKWSSFVEITTIYEKTYYVSCDERDDLIATIQQGKPNRKNITEF